MQKRFLAILAIVATVFALGVGSAMAERPGNAGPPNPHPACDKDDAPDWCEDYDGQPGDRDGEDGEDDGDDGGEGGEPGPQDLCDAIRGLDDGFAPVADACDQIVAALTGGGEGEDPGEGEGEDPGEGEGEGEDDGEEPAEESPSCADLAQLDPALAQGCQDLRDGLNEAGLPV
jgi:hypothetical protein